MEWFDPRSIEHRLLGEEHRTIMVVANDLLDAIDAPIIPLQQVARLRWKLAHLLAVHLAREDRCVYPVLSRHPDHAIAELASAFAVRMGGLASEYRSYMDRWNGDIIAADPQSFIADTRHIIAALAERVALEERELYPRLIG